MTVGDDPSRSRNRPARRQARSVKFGQTAEFEAAFAQAQRIISARSSDQRHELQRCLEDDHNYALLVWWDIPKARTVCFCGSKDPSPLASLGSVRLNF